MNQDEDPNVNERNSGPTNKEPVWQPLRQESETPLFLRDGSESKKGNAQDEKDKSEE